MFLLLTASFQAPFQAINSHINFTNLSFLFALCRNVSFLVSRIVRVTPAHRLASVCGFCDEPVDSMDLQSDVSWPDASKRHSVALGF